VQLIFLVPCVAIVILDVEVGLAIGVGFSLFAGVVLRTQMAKVQLLGRSLNRTAEPGTDGPDIRIVSQIVGKIGAEWRLLQAVYEYLSVCLIGFIGFWNGHHSYQRAPALCKR
jgi:hypothetical protein